MSTNIQRRVVKYDYHLYGIRYVIKEVPIRYVHINTMNTTSLKFNWFKIKCAILLLERKNKSENGVYSFYILYLNIFFFFNEQRIAKRANYLICFKYMNNNHTQPCGSGYNPLFCYVCVNTWYLFFNAVSYLWRQTTTVFFLILRVHSWTCTRLYSLKWAMFVK